MDNSNKAQETVQHSAEQGSAVGGPQGGAPEAKKEYTAGQVAMSCLLTIPIMILAQIAEFFQGIWELIVWVAGLFKNKWFLLGFALVVIFLILAAIGGNMQNGTATP